MLTNVESQKLKSTEFDLHKTENTLPKLAEIKLAGKLEMPLKEYKTPILEINLGSMKLYKICTHPDKPIIIGGMGADEKGLCANMQINDPAFPKGNAIIMFLAGGSVDTKYWFVANNIPKNEEGLYDVKLFLTDPKGNKIELLPGDTKFLQSEYELEIITKLKKDSPKNSEIKYKIKFHDYVQNQDEYWGMSRVQELNKVEQYPLVQQYPHLMNNKKFVYDPDKSIKIPLTEGFSKQDYKKVCHYMGNPADFDALPENSEDKLKYTETINAILHNYPYLKHSEYFNKEFESIMKFGDAITVNIDLASYKEWIKRTTLLSDSVIREMTEQIDEFLRKSLEQTFNRNNHSDIFTENVFQGDGSMISLFLDNHNKDEEGDWQSLLNNAIVVFLSLIEKSVKLKKIINKAKDVCDQQGLVTPDFKVRVGICKTKAMVFPTNVYNRSDGFEKGTIDTNSFLISEKAQASGKVNNEAVVSLDPELKRSLENDEMGNGYFVVDSVDVTTNPVVGKNKDVSESFTTCLVIDPDQLATNALDRNLYSLSYRQSPITK